MTWRRRPRSPPGTPDSTLQTRCNRLGGGALEHLAMATGANRDIVANNTEAVEQLINKIRPSRRNSETP